MKTWIVERKTDSFDNVTADEIAIVDGALWFENYEEHVNSSGKHTVTVLSLAIAAGEWLTVCEEAK